MDPFCPAYYDDRQIMISPVLSLCLRVNPREMNEYEAF